MHKTNYQEVDPPMDDWMRDNHRGMDGKPIREVDPTMDQAWEKTLTYKLPLTFDQQN